MIVTSPHQNSNPRKRQRSPPRPESKSQLHLKRPKPKHPIDGSQPPAAFWDNLSKIWLTKRALREVDRRSNQAAQTATCSSKQQLRKPLTRHAHAELKRSHPTPIQPAAEFLSNSTPACLKNIKLFARHGGPDIRGLRGCRTSALESPKSAMSSQQSSRGRKRGSESVSGTKSSQKTTTTKSTGPYDRAFQQNLIDHGIFPYAYEYPDGRSTVDPSNLEEIKARLAQPRSSLLPSDEDHKAFVRKDARASKEKQVSETVVPIFEGEAGGPCRSGGIPFGNLDHITDGTLKPGNPNLYYGAYAEQLNRLIRNELDGHIVPTTQDDLPILPNFFLAAKGPDGSATVANRQACYDGALGARGMHTLQSHKQSRPIYDNNAYTITSTYFNGTLFLYTSHPKEPSESETRPEYIMTLVRQWGMYDSAKNFREGVAAFRNALDWTKEKRNEFIENANKLGPSNVHAHPLAVDARSSLVSSFVTDTSRVDQGTAEPPSQESRTSLNDHSNVVVDVRDDEISADDPVSGKRQRRS